VTTIIALTVLLIAQNGVIAVNDGSRGIVYNLAM
jgi:hypothetical protein